MITLLVLLLLWLASPDLAAQQPAVLSIRGRVVDRETKAALPYASVGLRGKPIGTVANSEGEFDFYLPVQYARDTFFVSFLGYQAYRALAEAAQSDTVFKLAVQPTELAEVVIRESRLSAKEIVQRALDRIEQNYPTEPYLMEGFFRLWAKHEMPESLFRRYGAKRHGSLFEGAVSVYDQGYGTQRGGGLQEEVYLQEVRKNQLPPGQLEYRERRNWLATLLEGNYVKYNRALGNIMMLRGPLDLTNELEYQLLDAVEDSGETLYVIGVPGVCTKDASTPKSTAAYRLFISAEDYAILRIDLVGSSSGNDFVYGWSRHPLEKCISVDNTLRFRRYHGKLYLHYLRMEWKNRLTAEGTGAILAEGHDSHLELLVNDVITENVGQRKKGLGKPMKDKQPLEEQLKVYHPDFWQHYNLIRESPLDQELLQLLEKNNKLEEQFNQSTPKK